MNNKPATSPHEALRRHMDKAIKRGDPIFVAREFTRGDHVHTPDGNGVVIMPSTPGWDRITVLVADHKTLPYQRDFYAHQLSLRDDPHQPAPEDQAHE